MPLTSDHLYATLIVAAELIPVPLVDTLAQNHLRRRMVRAVALEGGLTVPEDTVHALADEPLRPVWRVLTWPLRKLVRVVLPPFALYLAYRELRHTLALAKRVRQGLADDQPSVVLLPQPTGDGAEPSSSPPPR